MGLEHVLRSEESIKEHESETYGDSIYRVRYVHPVTERHRYTLGRSHSNPTLNNIPTAIPPHCDILLIYRITKYFQFANVQYKLYFLYHC